MGLLADQLGNKMAGELIRSEDWNALVAAVESIEAALNAKIDAVEAEVEALGASSDDGRRRARPARDEGRATPRSVPRQPADDQAELRARRGGRDHGRGARSLEQPDRVHEREPPVGRLRDRVGPAQGGRRLREPGRRRRPRDLRAGEHPGRGAGDPARRDRRRERRRRRRDRCLADHAAGGWEQRRARDSHRLDPGRGEELGRVQGDDGPVRPSGREERPQLRRLVLRQELAEDHRQVLPTDHAALARLPSDRDRAGQERQQPADTRRRPRRELAAGHVPRLDRPVAPARLRAPHWRRSSSSPTSRRS